MHCPESRQALQRSVSPCRPPQFPGFPRLSAAAAVLQWPVALHQHISLQRHVSMYDLSRTLLQGSLGHQVFRLLSHLCWGAQRKESVANYTLYCVPVGASQQSTAPLQLSDATSMAPLEGGLDQPQEKGTH